MSGNGLPESSSGWLTVISFVISGNPCKVKLVIYHLKIPFSRIFFESNAIFKYKKSGAVDTYRPKVQFSLNPDWNKLGGRPTEIVELWSGKKLSEDDLNRLELNGHNFLMIGIR